MLLLIYHRSETLRFGVSPDTSKQLALNLHSASESPDKLLQNGPDPGIQVQGSGIEPWQAMCQGTR